MGNPREVRKRKNEQIVTAKESSVADASCPCNQYRGQMPKRHCHTFSRMPKDTAPQRITPIKTTIYPWEKGRTDLFESGVGSNFSMGGGL